MRLTVTASSGARVIVDHDNAGSVEMAAGETRVFEGSVVTFRELGLVDMTPPEVPSASGDSQ